MNWLFPTHARCMGCDAVRLPLEGEPFCADCRKGLEKAVLPKPQCGWCGYPMQGNECLFCQQGYARYIHWIIAPFVYRGPVRQALPRLKYWGWGQCATFFGQQMAQAWQKSSQPDPDLVTFVPMAPLLRRVRQTQSQVGLARAQRKRNLRGCFETVEKVRGKHVLLVDDVVTTGSTVAECARMLIRAGAAQVWVLAAAVNLKKK